MELKIAVRVGVSVKVDVESACEDIGVHTHKVSG